MSDTDATLAAIDAATGQLCACGCGTKLDPNGPSAWFVNQDHQRSYQERHATNPQDVYRRPDATSDDIELRREPQDHESAYRAIRQDGQVIRQWTLADFECRSPVDTDRSARP